MYFAVNSVARKNPQNPNNKNLYAQYTSVTSGSVLQLLCCYVPLALNRNQWNFCMYLAYLAAVQQLNTLKQLWFRS